MSIHFAVNAAPRLFPSRSYQLQIKAENTNPAVELEYSVIQKDRLNFVRLYFLNYTWYVNDLHNI